MPYSFLIRTERCILREFRQEDAEGMFRLNLHPDIFRFTTDPPFPSVSEAAAFLESYDSYKRTGIGRWTILSAETGEFIGWCGLKFILQENEVDVGYRLLPEHWGKGFAVECATACCNTGFREFGLKRIVARIHPENHRSIRVAEKMSMKFETDLEYENETWLNYVLHNA